MTFTNKNVEIYVPETARKGAATTYMSIAAHQDDIEIMAADGIIKAFYDPTLSFVCVVTADGAGSARDGAYVRYTDEEMMAIRRVEQKKAAVLGEYEALYLLNYKSSAVKSSQNIAISEDYYKILSKHKPQVVYTHNPLDKHDTHLGVAVKTVKAIRKMDKKDRPKHVYGCEVWRGLDWLDDKEKVAFELDKGENILQALIGVFDSQISGGKRYDLATAGRWLANATYFESHKVDAAKNVSFALDLTPLILDDNLDIVDYALSKIEIFKNDAELKLRKQI